MTRDDWFRRTAWSDSDARGFFARLNRSRSNFHKAQYLRIQAYTLSEAGDASLTRVAIGLLQHLFLEFPEPSELSSAHLQAAKCYEQLGDTAKALEHLDLSLGAQTSYPNRDTGASLEYPWFVARHKLADRYVAAMDTLQSARLAFPVAAFKAAATRALIAQEQGNPIAARYATEALEAAALEQSQFHYHRELGLVGEEYAPFIKRLRAIAAA